MALGLKPLKLKCNKDLFMAHTNVKSFTKGKIYETDGYTNYYNPTSIPEGVVVIDDENCRHSLGLWAKHFKIVK